MVIVCNIDDVGRNTESSGAVKSTVMQSFGCALQRAQYV